MIYQAKCDSWGFLGRTWYEGDLTPDLTKEQEKDPAIAAHFEPYDPLKEKLKEELPPETFSAIAEKMVERQQVQHQTGIAAGSQKDYLPPVVNGREVKSKKGQA